MKALGFEYIEPVVVNQKTSLHLPDALPQLHQMISQCHLCDLSKSRRQSMTGIGNPNARIMLVDGHVSMAEDESGTYYAGRSGASLQKMVENVLGLSCDDIYLTHAVKCKPFASQQPSPSEWNSCKPYVLKQIDIIKPEIIVALGPDAYTMLSGDETPFEQVRGQRIKFADTYIIPIYHPQFLLRNPSLKKETLFDLNTIKGYL